MTLAAEDATAAIHPPQHEGVARLRRKDAASILLIERTGPSPRVLVGRRSNGHVFMPGLYVFPGGRRDPGDYLLPYKADLAPQVMEKLLVETRGRKSFSRARALALAALRELREETGLGTTDAADLSPLRYVARAITPPGNIRRYDTRFFATFCDEAGFDTNRMSDSDELLDLRWLDMQTLSGLKLPPITQRILNDVTSLMATDPALPFGNPVTLYAMRYGRPVRSRL